jgi:hypothetical protein
MQWSRGCAWQDAWIEEELRVNFDVQVPLVLKNLKYVI